MESLDREQTMFFLSPLELFYCFMLACGQIRKKEDCQWFIRSLASIQMFQIILNGNIIPQLKSL